MFLASVPRMSFDAYHTKIHDMLKQQLAPAKLDALFSDLKTKFITRIFNSWGETGAESRIVLHIDWSN